MIAPIIDMIETVASRLNTSGLGDRLRFPYRPVTLGDPDETRYRCQDLCPLPYSQRHQRVRVGLKSGSDIKIATPNRGH